LPLAQCIIIIIIIIIITTISPYYTPTIILLLLIIILIPLSLWAAQHHPAAPHVLLSDFTLLNPSYEASYSLLKLPFAKDRRIFSPCWAAFRIRFLYLISVISL